VEWSYYNHVGYRILTFADAGLIFSPMKSFIAIFMILCLQVAMSPLCLCLGAGGGKEDSKPACCHAPLDEEPAPCPHCDQEMPIAATAPVKAEFDAEPPEWHGFSFFFAAELSDMFRPVSPEISVDWAVPPSDAPPLPFQAIYGVFLI
jgi:hypothetical protein